MTKTAANRAGSIDGRQIREAGLDVLVENDKWLAMPAVTVTIDWIAPRRTSSSLAHRYAVRLPRLGEQLASPGTQGRACDGWSIVRRRTRLGQASQGAGVARRVDRADGSRHRCGTLVFARSGRRGAASAAVSAPDAGNGMRVRWHTIWAVCSGRADACENGADMRSLGHPICASIVICRFVECWR
jgi:hypothetical protein